MPDYGCRSMVDPLRRVLVRRPSVAACCALGGVRLARRAEPRRARCGSTRPSARCSREQAATSSSPSRSTTIQTRSTRSIPAVVTEHGAILMRPGKAGRRAEPAAVGRGSRAGRRAGGRDGCRAGRCGGRRPHPARRGNAPRRPRLPHEPGGNRSRRAGCCPGVETLTFDLPHWHGETEVMHLLSLLSPLAADLVVAYPPLLPVALAQLLAERGIEIVPVPDDEFDEHGNERARARAACRARARRQPGDARRGSSPPAWRCSSTKAGSSRSRATAGRPA